MGGFILGVLIIGALLSTIFGKHVGAMFVLGTGTAVAICVGILLVLLSPLIWFYFTLPSPAAASGQTSSTSYQASSAGNQASSAGSNTGSSSYTGSSSTVSMPIIGVADGIAPNPKDEAVLNNSCNIPPGVGDYISGVDRGSAAEAAGLHVGDIMVSAWVPGSPRLWLSPQYALCDFEQAHPAQPGTQPISVHVYRLSTGRDAYIDITPR